MPTITCGRAAGQAASEAGRHPDAPSTPDPDGPGPLERRILGLLTDEIGAETYARYFDSQAVVRVVDGRLDVAVPTRFAARYVRTRFGEPLRRAAGRGMRSDPDAAIQVSFRVDQGAFRHADAPANNRAPGGVPGRPPPSSRPDRWRYTLDTFVVGEANRIAFAAAREAANPDTPPSPLFLHGPCGVGKTHLLQGIANDLARKRPDTRVLYVTAEVFTNEFISAVQQNRLATFRRDYRSLHLLCLDDVHFVASKEGTQAEVLHTFDAIGLGRNRIVLASDQHPTALSRMAPSLLSRFQAGLVVGVNPPDRALRENLVRRLVGSHGLAIEDEAVRLIVAACGPDGPPSVRDIEGIATRLAAHARHAPGTRGRLGLAAARWALGLDAPPECARPQRPVRVEQIVREVCACLGVSAEDLRGNGRHARVVLGRSLVVLLARELTTMSFPELARAIGRPNHSSVITAHKRVLAQIEEGQLLNPGGDLAGLRVGDLADRIRSRIVRGSRKG
jgi:chromosomal replication initiator protein